MFFSLGYTELLLLIACLVASLALQKQPYQVWARATLLSGLFAALVTPADIYSMLAVMTGMLVCLWIGSRYLVPAAVR